MIIVEETIWKNHPSPAMYVLSIGRINATLYKNYPVRDQAEMRIPGFYEKAVDALRKKHHFVVVAEPGARNGWGILKIGYTREPNMAAIAIAISDLTEYAGKHPSWNFRMDLPGEEFFPREMIEPLLVGLQDNVTVCARPIKTIPANITMRDVLETVQKHLSYGRSELAKEYLISLGWKNPIDQVNAVREIGVEELAWRQEERYRRLRSRTA